MADAIQHKDSHCKAYTPFRGVDIHPLSQTLPHTLYCVPTCPVFAGPVTLYQSSVILHYV